MALRKTAIKWSNKDRQFFTLNFILINHLGFCILRGENEEIAYLHMTYQTICVKFHIIFKKLLDQGLIKRLFYSSKNL